MAMLLSNKLAVKRPVASFSNKHANVGSHELFFCGKVCKVFDLDISL